ncbi:MAG TPA: flagellar biosynthesis protein [Candidatus Agathobaculum intestinipullorum]|nr:flagellar biosynthesis protein [Candidatus Agathobaculum merdavium]HJA48408.1 flagellar biosynthesis protein [Candidatus Agathobaculum intestinipullorum]
MIDRISGNSSIGQPLQQTAQTSTSTFGDLLRQRMEQLGAGQHATPSVEFSKHAQQRAEERGIEMTDDLMTQLANSVEKAQEKGAKNILVFDASRAFIVNVPQNRVITAISQEEMQDNVFTNIDGAVLLK